MRLAFLVDDHGTYKVLAGEHVVASPAQAYAAGLTDPTTLAQIATHTLGRGAKPLDNGSGAAICVDADGGASLTFFWSNGSEGRAPLTRPVRAHT